MAKSRYSNTSVIDGKYFETFKFPFPKKGLGDSSMLAGVKTIDHTFVRGERLDQLAAKYFNEDRYWWLIALVNNIKYAFSIQPGTVLKIPIDPKDIFDKLFP